MKTELETAVKRLQAYWRALWRVCPRCNSDAPERIHCVVCKGWLRGYTPTPDWLVATWLVRHFNLT
jgi:hypothetical protein